MRAGSMVLAVLLRARTIFQYLIRSCHMSQIGVIAQTSRPRCVAFFCVSRSPLKSQSNGTLGVAAIHPLPEMMLGMVLVIPRYFRKFVNFASAATNADML